MYQEGQTAINPKTGQRVVFRNGQWVIGTSSATVAKPLNSDEQKALIKKREEGERLQKTAQRLSVVEKYVNEGVNTGPLWGDPTQKASFTHLAPYFKGPKLQEIDAINNALAPQQRVEGSGATSDIEYRGMQLSLPSTNLLPQTNKKLIKEIKERQRESAAYVAFMDAYAAKNGTLSGAETAFDAFWADYTSNPKKYTQPKPQGLASVAQLQQPRPMAQPRPQAPTQGRELVYNPATGRVE